MIIFMLLFTACGTEEKTWQDYYDLGMRYLNEGNYEEAIISFTAAIEIDPKQEDVYIGMAEVYVQMEDTDAAIAILEEGYEQTESERILDKIFELKRQGLLTVVTTQVGTVYDYNDESEPWEDYLTYTYDKKGYMVHKEWSDKNKKRGVIMTTDLIYDQTKKEWVCKRYRNLEGKSTSEILDKYYPGSEMNRFISTCVGDSYSTVLMDPYLNAKSNIVYNSEYGEDKDVENDWYSAKYTYDNEGNVIHIDSYSKDGILLGTCDLEYTVIDLRNKDKK